MEWTTLLPSSKPHRAILPSPSPTIKPKPKPKPKPDPIKLKKKPKITYFPSITPRSKIHTLSPSFCLQ